VRTILRRRKKYGVGNPIQYPEDAVRVTGHGRHAPDRRRASLVGYGTSPLRAGRVVVPPLTQGTVAVHCLLSVPCEADRHAEWIGAALTASTAGESACRCEHEE